MEHINQNKIEVSLFKKAVGDYKKLGLSWKNIGICGKKCKR